MIPIKEIVKDYLTLSLKKSLNKASLFINNSLIKGFEKVFDILKFNLYKNYSDKG